MNKIVMITGGAKRIGKALVRSFADLGWKVVLHYNSSEKEAVSIQNEVGTDKVVMLLQADLRKADDIKRIFRRLRTESCLPNVIVNNAAVFPPPKNFRDITIDDWDDVISSNLNSVFMVSSAYVDLVKKGRIINFASLGSHEVWNGRSNYHAAKAGVLHLTRAMSRDLAPDFSVNSISPGVIRIPDDDNDDKSIAFEQRIPMKRFGNTDDIFDAVYFFATASKYITGQDLTVDGGWLYTR